jgi:hypothetical protein
MFEKGSQPCDETNSLNPYVVSAPGGGGGELSGAAPLLCGALIGGRVGPEPVEWVLWPVEVYAVGALLRTRLTPLGPWREYDDESWALQRTVMPPAIWAEHHDEIVLATAEGGPMRWVNVALPNAGVEPGHGDMVWNHSWTLEFWWPREEWRSPARLSWPARGVDVVQPVDPAALECLAATRPAPPDVTVEAHHPGFEDLPLKQGPGLEAHRPPPGGTRRWPHHEDGAGQGPRGR